MNKKTIIARIAMTAAVLVLGFAVSTTKADASTRHRKPQVSNQSYVNPLTWLPPTGSAITWLPSNNTGYGYSNTADNSSYGYSYPTNNSYGNSSNQYYNNTPSYNSYNNSNYQYQNQNQNTAPVYYYTGQNNTNTAPVYNNYPTTQPTYYAPAAPVYNTTPTYPDTTNNNGDTNNTGSNNQSSGGGYSF